MNQAKEKAIEGYKRGKHPNSLRQLRHLKGDANYDEIREKISKSHMGMKPSLEAIRKTSMKNKGKHIHSEEHKKKMSLLFKDRFFSEETKRKISIAKKGKKFSNEHIQKIRLTKIGVPLSLEHRKKISLANIGRRWSWDEEAKRKITGRKCSMETRMKMKEHRKHQIFPMNDTSIEVKIQNFLKQLGIDFFTHQYINIEHGYQCDILIPSMNMVVECDGNYWHKYPIGKDIDHIRTKELIDKGFKVLRLWEFEIKKMGIDDFKMRLRL